MTIKFCSLTFLLLLATVCSPNFSAPYTAAAGDLWERELKIEYQLAFEEHLYVNLEELYALEAKTNMALQDNSIALRNFTTTQQHLHKLKSYIAYLHLAAILDEQGLIKRELTALLFHKLRQTAAEHIDIIQTNDDFYQQVRRGEIDTTAVDRDAKQKFFQTLLATLVKMTEDALHLQQHLLPFMRDDFEIICQKDKLCPQIISQVHDQNFPHQPFSDLEQLTASVNQTISDLNVVIATLNEVQPNKQQLFFQETNFEDDKVVKLYQYYELALMQAAHRGVLPLMFAETFRTRSGNLWLKQNGINSVHNKLLTEVTETTVAIAYQETQQNLLDSLAQLQKMQKRKSSPRDKKIYQWIVNNEVATARIIAQNPVHARVVANLLHRYQHEVRNPRLRFIDIMVTSIEISCLLMIVPALIANSSPVLAALNLPRTVAFVGTLMNFPWIGLTQTKHLMARNRYLMLERALLRGSSERITYNLKLLHEMQRLRKSAIISGTIGFTLSVPAINYIINNADVGFRNNLVDIVSSIFSDYENLTMFMHESTIDMSESELETKPGH